MKLSYSIALLAAGVLLSACTSTEKRLPCASDSSACAEGLVCIDSQCLPCIADRECVADPLYGAGSLCGEGSCCTVGEVGCGCFANESCRFGNTCAADACVECTTGTEGCPCTEAGDCTDGTTCLNGVCAISTCVAGDARCPCNEDGTCNAGLSCNDERVCGECVLGTRACPCRGDQTCGSALTCDAGICQDCVDGKAGCACRTDGSCEGDLECTAGDVCERVERTCLELDCGAQGRRCEGEPFAICTGCDADNNFVPDGQGGCALAAGACTSSLQCPAGQYCLQLSVNGVSSCVEAPACTELEPAAGEQGQAWDRDSEGC
ncbi:MAG: hypothetical protein KC621_00805, partial [Myxococcales bacterium]|nr:hypothetical protein [Myxococcales bacterium]